MNVCYVCIFTIIYHKWKSVYEKIYPLNALKTLKIFLVVVIDACLLNNIAIRLEHTFNICKTIDLFH